jgi:hypothetical protein
MRSTKRWIRRPSAGTAIGCVALMVALGGTAEALDGINTVENDDLKNNVVTSREIAPNEVRSNDLHNGAVHDEHLARILEEDGTDVELIDAANDGDWTAAGQSTAQCPDGTKLIGGSMEWDTDGAVNGDLSIVSMFPNFTTNTWTARGGNDEGTREVYHAIAFCIR